MFGYVMEDLTALPEQPTAIVEGPQILPDLLRPEASAVFLIPTADFQRNVLSARPMPSSDPERALAARLVKDRLHAHRVATLANERGFPVLELDGLRPPEEMLALVQGMFADLLRESEPLDLTAVRKWENENTARNLRAWISSGDLRGNAEMLFPFACECGRLGCAARVELRLGQIDTATESVLAPGHTPPHS